MRGVGEETGSSGGGGGDEGSKHGDHGDTPECHDCPYYSLAGDDIHGKPSPVSSLQTPDEAMFSGLHNGQTTTIEEQCGI